VRVGGLAVVDVVDAVHGGDQDVAVRPTAEAGEPAADRLGRNAEGAGQRRRGQGVDPVVRPGDLEVGQVQQQLPRRVGPERAVDQCPGPDPELAGTRVLVLTGRDQPDDRAAARDAGADAYLVKPFSSLALLDAVKRLTDG